MLNNHDYKDDWRRTQTMHNLVKSINYVERCFYNFKHIFIWFLVHFLFFFFKYLFKIIIFSFLLTSFGFGVIVICNTFSFVI